MCSNDATTCKCGSGKSIFCLAYKPAVKGSHYHNCFSPLETKYYALIHYSQITLKLVLAYGVSELVGFVQLPWHGNQEARLVERTFGLLYDLVRSLRGVVIFLAYICKRTVFNRFRNLIHPSRNVDEIVRCGNVALDVATRKRQMPPHSRRNQDHCNTVGKVKSRDTTNVRFRNQAYSINKEDQEKMDEGSEISLPENNQATTIDEEDQEKKLNESGENAPAENKLPRALSIAKAIGADLVMGSENTLDTKSDDMIEAKEQQPMQDHIIYV